MSETAAIRARTSHEDIDAFVDGYGPYFDTDGVFIRTRAAREIGTTLRFELQLSTGDVAFRGEGIVTEVRSAITSVPGMRIRFSKLDRNSKKLMDAILSQRQIRTTLSDPHIKAPGPTEEPDAEVATSADPLDQTPMVGTIERPAEPEVASSEPQTTGSFGLTSQDLEEIADRVEKSLDSVFFGDLGDEAGPFEEMFAEEAIDQLDGPVVEQTSEPAADSTPSIDTIEVCSEAKKLAAKAQEVAEQRASDESRDDSVQVFEPEPLDDFPDDSGGLGALVASAAESNESEATATDSTEPEPPLLEITLDDFSVEIEDPEAPGARAADAEIDSQSDDEDTDLHGFDDGSSSPFPDFSDDSLDWNVQSESYPGVPVFSEYDEADPSSDATPRDDSRGEFFAGDAPATGPHGDDSAPPTAEQAQKAQLAAFEADLEENPDPDALEEDPEQIPLPPDEDDFDETPLTDDFGRGDYGYSVKDEWLGGEPDDQELVQAEFSQPIDVDSLVGIELDSSQGEVMPFVLEPLAESGLEMSQEVGLDTDSTLGDLNLALASHFAEPSEEIALPLVGVEALDPNDPLDHAYAVGPPSELGGPPVFRPRPDSEIYELEEDISSFSQNVLPPPPPPRVEAPPVIPVSHEILAESLPFLEPEPPSGTSKVDSLMNDLLSQRIPVSKTDIPAIPKAVVEDVPLELPANMGFPLPVDDDDAAGESEAQLEADYFDHLASQTDSSQGKHARSQAQTKSGVFKRIFGRKKR